MTIMKIDWCLCNDNQITICYSNLLLIHRQDYSLLLSNRKYSVPIKPFTLPSLLIYVFPKSIVLLIWSHFSTFLLTTLMFGPLNAIDLTWHPLQHSVVCWVCGPDGGQRIQCMSLASSYLKPVRYEIFQSKKGGFQRYEGCYKNSTVTTKKLQFKWA